MIGVLLAALLGCASEPIPTSQAVSVPRERILNVDIHKPRPSTGSLIVKRDPGLRGAACEYRLHENGRRFADILPGEKVQIYLSAGDHIIGIKNGPMCNGDIETLVTVKVGKTITYRTALTGNNEVILQPTAF
jgi:hypothetical protein